MVVKPRKGLCELADLPFTQVPQKVELWGIPGSCWADCMCRAELAYMVMCGQTTFLCRLRAGFVTLGAALRVGIGTCLCTSTWL